MAVKKANAVKKEVKVETPVVEVENTEVKVETPVVEPVETKTEENTEEPTVEEQETESTKNEAPVVEVEEPKEEVKVEVDETPVDTTSQAKKNVRIRMRVDHKCCVNTEIYDFKKGQCYNVPQSVKMRLNKAGVLLPL